MYEPTALVTHVAECVGQDQPLGMAQLTALARALHQGLEQRAAVEDSLDAITRAFQPTARVRTMTG